MSKKYLFLDFDRTLFDTERFYKVLEENQICSILEETADLNFKDLLYPDAEFFLKKCVSLNLNIFLLTYGNRKIQEYKFKKTGISGYFTGEIYVEAGEKADFIKNLLSETVSRENIYFIDDTISHLEYFSKVYGEANPIRICRKNAKGADLIDHRFSTVTNLQDVLKIL